MGFLAPFIYSQLFVTPEYPTKSFAGQTVIVTGSNIGLGLEAARHFVRLNAEQVILAVRNLAAGEEAKSSIEESTGRKNVCEVWELDLTSYASVQKFAKRASSEIPKIDVLLQNAGVATKRFELAENHETTITVNVISTFLLGLLLLPKLEETAAEDPIGKPRWSIVTSEVHALTNLPESKHANTFISLDDPQKSNMEQRYSTSKLIEVLVVRELAEKITNNKVILNMLNPGLCHSTLWREKNWVVYILSLLLGRTTEVGARCLVAGAAAGEESYGAYMTDGKVSDAHLSAFVTTDEGRDAQKKVWSELKAILEDIVPGVTAFY
jgi:NAD(P)-dependent dehydrogenase (short-subunit alcohol dehydrogenase family)